jgi:hypothetical protein
MREEVPEEGQTQEEEAATMMEEAPEEAPVEEEEQAARKPEKRRSGAVPFVGGGVLGTLVGAGVCVALFFAGVIPGGSGTPAPRNPVGPVVNPAPQAEAPSLDRLKKGLLGGDFAQALETANKMGPNEEPDFLAARGEAGWLSSLQQLAKDNKALTKDELAKMDGVLKAKEDLTKANTADALFWLGHMAEVLEGPASARAKFQEGLQKFPTQQKRFQGALDSLDVRTPPPAGAGARLSPNEIREGMWLALAVFALQPPPGGNMPQPGGAGAGQPGGAPCRSQVPVRDSPAGPGKATPGRTPKRPATTSGRPSSSRIKETTPRRLMPSKMPRKSTTGSASSACARPRTR